ncbi:signal peptidase II [Spiroplasma endosymbiont of Aspidapion aeneum]|uniref:signal peptidase II n=1 Tax=Spiroplasma endosymbiont of Aspidapion aeneum TaxID=3066276 RepID=UPI00313B99D0
MFEVKNFFANYYYQYIFKILFSVPLIIVCVIIDWTTKGVITNNYAEQDGGTIVKGLLRWQYAINKGSAYGTNADNLSLSITLATFGTLFLFVGIIFIRNKFAIIGFSFAFAGSFANLIGRIWGKEHGVVDFLIWDFGYNGGFLTNYIFNMADMFVNIGITIAIIYFIYYFSNMIWLYILKNINELKYSKICQYSEDVILAKHNFEIKLASTLFKSTDIFKNKVKNIKNSHHELKDLLKTIKKIKKQTTDISLDGANNEG